jgi:replicative DNA helicase
MKILEEISQRSGGVRLREDNILFLLSVKLKDICNEFGVFILSSTQLNGDWKSSDMPDQNLLRGAKSIADKIDCGMILLDVTEEDEKALKDIVSKEGYEMPNVKMSIYKNRRGSYNKCYLWMIADKSTCRFNALFCTSYDYKFIPIKESVIEF